MLLTPIVELWTAMLYIICMKIDPQRDHVKGEKAVEMARIGWRKRRGIKLIMSIVPMQKPSKLFGSKMATCIFEGKTYIGTGKTHTEALEECVKAITKDAKLD